MTDVYNQMLTASMDVAIARLNTILLQLIQHPLEAEQCQAEVNLCQRAIDDFFGLIVDMDTWPTITHWWWRWRLHRVGTKKIPRIKTLLNNIQKNVD
jgi:hypothetical protein